MYRLVFKNGQHQGQRLLVRRRLTIVGSAASAHLRLEAGEGLAPEHVQIEEQGPTVVATPLDARFPVLRNGARMEAPAVLVDQDILTLGNIELQYKLFIAQKSWVKRSPGVLQPMTLLVILGLLLVQLVLVAYMVQWPKHLLGEEIEMNAVDASAPEIEEPLDAVPGEVEKTESLAEAEPTTSSTQSEVAEAPPIHQPPIEKQTISITPPSVLAAAPEILEALRDADFLPVDTNNLISPPPISAVDDATAVAQKTLAAAVAAAEFADYGKAFSLLAELHRTAPDFLPAYMEHARLLEANGQLERAVEIWGMVLARADESGPFRKQARAERRRLQALIRLKPVATPQQSDETLSPPVFTNLTMRRVPSDENVEDMRVLEFQLVTPDGREIMPGRLDIVFFDRLPDGTEVPTTAIVTPGHILYADVSSPPLRTITATYVVPRGSRQREARDGLGTRRYAGYAIYLTGPGGQVLTSEARPKNLIQQFPLPPTAEE